MSLRITNSDGPNIGVLNRWADGVEAKQAATDKKIAQTHQAVVQVQATVSTGDVPNDPGSVSTSQAGYVNDGTLYSEITATYTAPNPLGTFAGIFLVAKNYRGSAELVKLTEHTFAGAAGGTASFKTILQRTNEVVTFYFVAKNSQEAARSDWANAPSSIATLDGGSISPTAGGCPVNTPVTVGNTFSTGAIGEYVAGNLVTVPGNIEFDVQSTGGIVDVFLPTSTVDKFPGSGLSANWTVEQGTFSVATGAVGVTAGGGDSRALVVRTESFTANQAVQVTCAVAPTGSNTIGVCVRGSAVAETFYAFYIDNTTAYIFKVIAGVLTVLTSVAKAMQVGDVVRLEVVGTNLTAKLNGAVLLTASDASIASGAPGLQGLTGTGVTTKVTNFIADNNLPNGYAFRFDGRSGLNLGQLIKVTAGALANFGTAKTSVNSGTVLGWHHIEGRITTDGIFDVFVDGIWQCSGADTAFTSTGSTYYVNEAVTNPILAVPNFVNRTLDHVADGTRAAWDSTTQKAAAVDASGNLLLKNIGVATGSTPSPSLTSVTYAVIPEMTQTKTFKGNKVIIIFSGNLSTSGTSIGKYALFKDGTQLSTDFEIATQGAAVVIPASLIFIDTPSAASHTYDIRWASEVGGQTIQSLHTGRTLQIIELG